MKIEWNRFLICSVLAGASTTGSAASLLTFDELPTPQVIPGENYGPITNGYGGLRWDNFDVLDGAIEPTGRGYHDGMVSPDNVAFNPYGSPASISIAGGLFDLNSAYMSLALNLDTPLNVEVQGYRGATLLYDNTFTVNRFAPTLLTFDYLGIDRVSFLPSPSQEFAMDNLTVTIPEPGTVTLLILGTVWLAAGSCRSRLVSGGLLAGSRA